MQETLLTLLQYTQLFKWGPGGLVSIGEATDPAVTVKVQMALQVPTSFPV